MLLQKPGTWKWNFKNFSWTFHLRNFSRFLENFSFEPKQWNSLGNWKSPGISSSTPSSFERISLDLSFGFTWVDRVRQMLGGWSANARRMVFFEFLSLENSLNLRRETFEENALRRLLRLAALSDTHAQPYCLEHRHSTSCYDFDDSRGSSRLTEAEAAKSENTPQKSTTFADWKLTERKQWRTG